MAYKIIRIDTVTDLWVQVIRQSFETVAKTFNLTEVSVPTNGAFIKIEALHRMMDQGVACFGLLDGDIPVGFVAVEQASDQAFRLEKLAVLPAFRHKGYGRLLVQWAVAYAASAGGAEMTIGVIDDHETLKKWYLTLGFHTIKRKKFKHLPFAVCFMKKSISEKDMV